MLYRTFRLLTTGCRAPRRRRSCVSRIHIYIHTVVCIHTYIYRHAYIYIHIQLGSARRGAEGVALVDARQHVVIYILIHKDIQAAGAEVVDADDWVPRAAGNMRWAFFPFLFAEHSARSAEKVFLFLFSLFFFCPPFVRGTTFFYSVPTVLPLFYRCFYYSLYYNLTAATRTRSDAFWFDFFFRGRWSSLRCAHRFFIFYFLILIF